MSGNPTNGTGYRELDPAFSADGTTLILGDSITHMAEMDAASVDMAVFSPPFPGMYVYSDSERDMGNTHDLREFVGMFRPLIRELYRVTMPGRSCAIHFVRPSPSIGPCQKSSRSR